MWKTLGGFLALRGPSQTSGRQKLLTSIALQRLWFSSGVPNSSRCTPLTPRFVNTASGLTLHRFEWLENSQIGALPAQRWNHLIDVQPPPSDPAQGGPLPVHWTKGGPWFRDYRHAGAELAAEWFASRDAAFRLWD
jgi:hypothetical protein